MVNSFFAKTFGYEFGKNVAFSCLKFEVILS